MTPIFGRLAATCVSVLALAHAMQVGASTPNVAAPSSVPSQGYPAIAKAPAGAPNILLVLTDDVGFGAASTFGGPGCCGGVWAKAADAPSAFRFLKGMGSRPSSLR